MCQSAFLGFSFAAANYLLMLFVGFCASPRNSNGKAQSSGPGNSMPKIVDPNAKAEAKAKANPKAAPASALAAAAEPWSP